MNITAFEFITIDTTAAVTTLTINRPAKLNALNSKLLSELDAALSIVATDDAVRAVIITGAGGKAFVAGADIAEMNKLSPTEAETFSKAGQQVFSRIENFEKPVIAAVNGFAFGGGAELVWACHIRLASANALFGQPEINLGLIPGYGATQRLSRLIPENKATELLLTGDSFSAQNALEMGILNAVYEPELLIEEAGKLAAKVAAKPAQAVKLLLKAIRASRSSSEAGFAAESTLFGLCFGTEDFKEGTAAFLEKRKPVFTHK